VNDVIKEDFADFIDNEELYNSTIKLYDQQNGTLKYEGQAIYDKKPQLVENEQNQLNYQGHKSILSLSMSKLDFMDTFFSLKGYYVEITYNSEILKYKIANDLYNSNVDAIYCELKVVED
jgi:hypothetical protein